MTQSTPGMGGEKSIRDMSDRELLIRTYTVMESVQKDVAVTCAAVKEHEGRIRILEHQDAVDKGAKGAGKDKTALIISISAIVISLVATIGNLLM